MNTMTIPQIREEMKTLAAEMKTLCRRQQSIARRYETLAELTHRRSFTRAPSKSRRVTKNVRLAVIRYAAEHPTATQQEIAEAHGINTGRISEILHGKRA